jgi:8-oxo-dGTP pyrophosphatase MutT (NUDIX family)
MSNSNSSHARPLGSFPGFDPRAQSWHAADQGLSAVGSQWLKPEPFRRLWSGIVDWKQEDSLGAELSSNRRQAAVLIPLVMRPEGLRVMLTQRTAHLTNHAGQISFPGGRAEAEDATPVDTALREALEETGLPASYVEVLGSMPEYGTTSGFTVTPVVGLVKPGFVLEPDASEVAEVFETPMEFLMNPVNHRLYDFVLPDGYVRHYFAMSWEQHFIWGATAGMLRNLYRTLYGAMPATVDQ